MGVIYLRTNLVNGMQYVGQSKDFKRRQAQWKCLGWIYSNKLLTEDRNKYGLDNWKVEILEECDDSKLNELEKKYIKELNTIYPNGYNDNEGGDIGFHHSEETKKKISEANKGKDSWAKGKHFTLEHRKKISEANKGKPPYAAIKKHAENTSKQVFQYTLDGKLVAVYPNIRNAAKETGLCFASIKNCCNGGFYSNLRKKWYDVEQYKGYKWSFNPL